MTEREDIHDGSDVPQITQYGRRTFLKTAVVGAAVAGFPTLLRAQAPTIKLGVVHCVTGPLRRARAGVPAGGADRG